MKNSLVIKDKAQERSSKISKKSQERSSKISKKSQVTVFIILAIAIVAVIGLYVVFQEDIVQKEVPKDMEPVYNYYLSCIENNLEQGVRIVEQQGGYIEKPDFEPGNSYMPFSNQLDFMGNGVPYWYYVSGNNIKKEQVPSKLKIQEQLGSFVESEIDRCDFSEYREKGYEIGLGNSEVDVSVKDNSVDLGVEQELVIMFGNETWSRDNHEISYGSQLGKFYETAKKIYENEQNTLFLEDYALDVLRLYAPVDGSEIGCSPKIWNKDEIRKELIVALESNVQAIKLKGDYYNLKEGDKGYFVHDIGEEIGMNANFMYLREWPMRMQVWPSEGNLMQADPVGLQEGMGMLGFCYVNYHFVYDLGFPVMIQLYSGDEMFQFPVVVYIDKNKQRKAEAVEGMPDVVPELCEKRNTKLEVYTYDTNLNAVEANISFKCFDTRCEIGETKIQEGDAVLTDYFPQCGNGYIIADSNGYERKKQLVTTLNQSIVDIILDRKYNLSLEIKKGNEDVENAIITFTKDDRVRTYPYPETTDIELTSGQYEVKMYVYTNSSIRLQGESMEKCVAVPKSGILGIFGGEEEKCFDVDIPSQMVSQVVSGGGTQNYYLTETILQDSEKIIINSQDFGVPNKVQDLQSNYNKVEVSNLDISLE